MSEGRSFQGSTGTGGRTGRRAAILVVVLLAAFLGVAIAKRWGAPTSPGSTTTPSGIMGAPPAPSIQATAPEASRAAIPSTLGPSAVDGGFTTPVPPETTAAWSGLQWRRVEHDPLALVTSALRWRGGFVALGWVEAGNPMTPVWTSMDGAHWELLPFNTSTTFWPGSVVLEVAEVPGGLVALTEAAYDCSRSPCSPTYVPLAVAWTSPDGQAWTPHEALPADWLSGPTASPPLLAVGPAGVVAATSGPAARIATSTDGVGWQHLPASTLPARFWLDDLGGIATGYVAVGRWRTSDRFQDDASLWSADGTHWSREPTFLPTSPRAGLDAGSAIVSLVPGLDGLVAVGRDDALPGGTAWWQSSDGRRWEPLPTFGPLGATTCTDDCGRQPDGTLAGDGQRLLAVRGGPGAEAWESSDGNSWRRLEMTGEVPGREAARATVLPGGVLVTDGSTTWFGEALVR